MRRIITAREQYEMLSPWRTADLMNPTASPQDDSQLNDYLQQAHRNLMATSRTAQGVVDTSASPDKAQQMSGVSGDQAADLATNNFHDAIRSGYAQRDRQFQSPGDVRNFVEGMAGTVNKGILGPDSSLIRQHDSPKYPYTAAQDLPGAMDNFYGGLHARLNDPNSDPVETAAYAEYGVDPGHHLFSDGCGKTAKALSSYVLMRHGMSLPTYPGGRDEYYRHVGRTQPIGPRAYDGDDSYKDFLNYYRSMVRQDHPFQHQWDGYQKAKSARIARRRYAMPVLAPESQLALPDMPRQPSQEEYARHMADVKQKLDWHREQGLDTRNMYGEYKGDWKNNRGHMKPTRERAAQQRQVIRHFYDTIVSKAARGGELSFMAGLGGSGKGMAQSNGHRRKLKDAGVDLDQYATIDKDAIQEYMAQKGMMPDIPGMSAMEASALGHEEASRLAQRLADIAHREGRNVNWDIVAGSPSSVTKRIDRARKVGPQYYDHKKPSAVLVDADPPVARQGVEDRHFGKEVAAMNGQGLINETTGKPIGGRWVPQEASDANAAPPGSSYASGPAATFHALNDTGQLGTALSLDRRQPGMPMTVETKGQRRPPPQPQPPQPQQMAFPNITGSTGMSPTLEDLLLGYEHGEIAFPQLVSAIASTPISPHQNGGDWGEVYRRAEAHPDPNDYHWIESAQDCGFLTPQQVDQIDAVIEQQ